MKFLSEWRGDKQNGFGIENWNNGVYQGNFVNGMKQGLGMLTVEQGHVYTGEFNKNEISGVG